MAVQILMKFVSFIWRRGKVPIGATLLLLGILLAAESVGLVNGLHGGGASAMRIFGCEITLKNVWLVVSPVLVSGVGLIWAGASMALGRALRWLTRSLQRTAVGAFFSHL